MRTSRALGAVSLGLALALTACGSDNSGAGDGTGHTTAHLSSSEHNAADVTFASDMIEHHAQALSMVELTKGRPLDPRVQALAEEIRAAQAPEVKTMIDWLQEWGAEVPETMPEQSDGGHDTHVMGGDTAGMDDMPGMMTTEEITALEEAGDAEFQELWLEKMKKHHEGAIEMARIEQADGQYGPAVDLAGQVVAAQSKEIETIDALLS